MPNPAQATFTAGTPTITADAGEPQPVITYFADLVRSTSSTSLIENAGGIFVWLRTSDGNPLEQERFAANRWFSVRDDTDEPDFVVRIGSSVNVYRFRMQGGPWLPSNDGIGINGINWRGQSTYRIAQETQDAEAEFRAGVPSIRAEVRQPDAATEFRAGVPRLTATALNPAQAEFRAGVPRIEAAALQSDVFAVFRAGVPRIRAQGLQLAAAQFRAGVPTARAIALRSAKAEFRAGVPRVMAFEDPAAEFRAGVPSVRAAALQTGAAEFRAGVPFVVARANIDEDITPLVPVVPPGPTPTPAPGNYVSIDRPDLHHTLRTLLDSGRSPDPATFQQFAQYLYSLGENVEELIRSGGTGTGTGTGTTPALPPDDEGGSERFFPFAYGLPYDNRNTVSAVTATGGAWLATAGGIAVQEPEAFPWETIDSLTFSRVDAEGVSRFPIYNAPEFRADGAALLLALRHEDEDGAETRVAYQMTGPIVSVPDGSWRFTVSRSETARMYDVGNYAAHNPLHNRNFPLRLLLPQVTQIRNFPTGRKPSWFFTQVSADIATKLEAIDANDEFPDDAVIAAEAILPTDPVPGDIVTLYRGTTVVSRGYTSDGRWSSIRLFIDGNLFVHGSIQTDALGANVVTAPKINVGKGLITGEDGQSLEIGVGANSGLVITDDAIAIGIKSNSGISLTEEGIGLLQGTGISINAAGIGLLVGAGLEVDGDGDLVPKLGAGLSLVEGEIVASVPNPLGGSNSISITGDKISLNIASRGGLEVVSGGVRVTNLDASVITTGTIDAARLSITDGRDGADGNRIFFGVGEPSAALGSIGDAYFDSNATLYNKTASATWTLRANLRGAPGLPGPRVWDRLMTGPQNIGLTAYTLSESVTSYDAVIIQVSIDPGSFDIYGEGGIPVSRIRIAAVTASPYSVIGVAGRSEDINYVRVARSSTAISFYGQRSGMMLQRVYGVNV